MVFEGMQIIAGEFTASGSEQVAAVSPLDGGGLPGSFVSATAEEVDAACSAAGSAWRKFRAVPRLKRAALLRRIATEIEASAELIERCHVETGLPVARLEGERARTCNQLRLFATLVEEGSWVDARITTAMPERTPAPRLDLRRKLVSLGPVAVFCASNFPLAFSVAGGDTASALAAGCPVVVKAHSSHPGTAELVARAIVAAINHEGLPPGIFSMLHGPGRSVGVRLVENPQVAAVGFTGSHAGGMALAKAASSRPRPIPVYAEMSSINPVFILPRAATSRGAEIAAGLTASVTLGVGQFCTNPGLVTGLAGPGFTELVEQVGSNMGKVGAGVMLNRSIGEAYAGGVETLASNPQVRTVARGTKPDDTAIRGQAALFSTSAADLLSNPVLSNEVFGPATLFVEARDREELMQAANALEGHLTCTLHGTEEDLEDYAELVEVLQEKAGRLIFNGYPTGVEVCEAMTHGGPYPATTDPHFTSVGTGAILRFSRPVTYQGFPDQALPEELQAGNPAGIMRLVDGTFTREALPGAG